jgi:hypothetical protein
MKRKPYFCQTDLGINHKAKYFQDIDEARKWLSENGGGTIKKRGAGIINDPFIGEIKVWCIVDNVSA